MLNRVKRSVVLGCCFVFAAAAQGMAADYDHTIEAKDMTFSWKIDGDKLAAKVTAKTEGWVGVGFNPSEKMKDANFVIGYVKDGKVKIDDEFGIVATGHKSDKDIGGTEDVTEVGGSEEKGVTTIEFAMPLQSSDEKDQKIDVNGDTTLLLAYGAGRDSFKTRHTYRTIVKVNLSTGEVKE